MRLSMLQPAVYIGTSGWSYRHWGSSFYPAHVSPAHYLPLYAQLFSAVEINTTFYHLPTKAAIAHWVADTPENFIFSVKVSRLITHYKRLRDCKKNLALFVSRIAGLGVKQGPLLVQIPQGFKKDSARLEEFFALLPKNQLVTCEFRDTSWYTKDIFSLLSHYEVALCVHDFNGNLSPLEVTAPFVYVRLHGPKHPYQGSYSLARLRQWKQRILHWHQEGLPVYCFFNNDQQGYAARNALQLQELLALRK